MTKKIKSEQNHILEINIREAYRDALRILLYDYTTQQNILWCTSDYEDLGQHYSYFAPILPSLITGEKVNIIRPRAQKDAGRQRSRIREMAEVFTPVHICNAQNNLVDEAWFGRKNVFNEATSNPTGKISWLTNQQPINFPEGKAWQDYIKDTRLEITCGEAPYLTSRLDAATGKYIPVDNRIGLLDRKLRVINENVTERKQWLKATQTAYKSIYAFEWQGDSLFLAREALLYTFIDHYFGQFGKLPHTKSINFIASIISRNVWQMDGLKGVIPKSCIEKQAAHFDKPEKKAKPCEGCLKNDFDKHSGLYCDLIDWSQKDENTCQNGMKIKFIDLGKNRLINTIVGNPPYQKMDGGAQASATPIYNKFFDLAEKINPRYLSLIMPSRWMTGGKGLDKFRAKRLKDKHISILHDFPDASDCFNHVEIKGGVSYFLRDSESLSPCKFFFHETKDKEIIASSRFLNAEGSDIIIRDSRLINLKNKALSKSEDTFNTLVSTMKPYGLRGDFFKNPRKYDLPPISKNPIKNGYTIIGLNERMKRVKRYIRNDYPMPKNNGLNDYKIFIPRNFGSGKMGEMATKTIIATPGLLCTETFVQIYPFNNLQEAVHCNKYMLTKFFRLLLGVRKQDQGAGRKVYQFIPQQDFSTHSDINWNKTISEIDNQLYEKYHFNQKEIKFIDSRIKPRAWKA